ncbi:MAG: prepilin-type N-terminal cleavage/methylation domain-containing protein [Phycisphaerales bacterium]|nr:prepilin-type N-terminal cleavage/methylation domain-containing protein [Phycisphaerales bacterium]
MTTLLRAHPASRAPRPRRRGFSLIECVVAVVVLGLAVPSLLFAIRQAHFDRAAPVNAAKARWLATERLEDVIADRQSDSRGWAYLVASNYPAETQVAGFTRFSRSVSLVELGPNLGPGSNYMRVTVTVTWSDGDTGQRSLAVTTVLTRYGSY